jgi:cyclopropane fatty-acyl-phospholipid synthase-like methyltransferase
LHTGDHKSYQFNIITLWEVFEHFTYAELYCVLDNIKAHLTPNGLIFATTSQGHNYHKLYKEIDMHRTRKNRDWWSRRFREANLIEVPEIEKQFEGKFLRHSRTNDKFVLRVNG